MASGEADGFGVAFTLLGTGLFDGVALPEGDGALEVTSLRDTLNQSDSPDFAAWNRALTWVLVLPARVSGFWVARLQASAFSGLHEPEAHLLLQSRERQS